MLLEGSFGGPVTLGEDMLDDRDGRPWREPESKDDRDGKNDENAQYREQETLDHRRHGRGG